MERQLIKALPDSLRPPKEKAVLITIEDGERGFPAMDLAMTLRGLCKLQPRAVFIDGVPDGSSESLPLLKSVRSHLLESGVVVTEAVLPSQDATYRAVSLCRYDPPDLLRPASGWPVIAGRTSGTGSAPFLTDDRSGQSLQLFASTASGDPVGSLWWNCLEPSRVNAPIWLLCGRYLLFPNHAPLLIDSHGKVSKPFLSGLPGAAPTIMTLDDFLLKIEEMERGTVSPGFDTLWDRSLVIVTAPRHVPAASSAISLRERLAFARLPASAQLLMAVLWTVLLAFSNRFGFRIITGLVLLLVTIGSSAAALSHGLILPFQPLLITALFLLIPWRTESRP